MKKISIVIFLIFACGILTFASCRDTGKALTPGGEPIPSVVVDCTLPENAENADCIKACEEDPTKPWCKIVTPKYLCPSDGSFKIVNPFTGADIALSETSPVADADGEIILTAKPFKEEDYTTVITAKGSDLKISPSADAPLIEIDLGSTIMSVDTFSIDGKNYVVAGTAKGLKVVPFSKEAGQDTATIDSEGLKTIDKIGGAAQVNYAASVDLSGAGYALSLPTGMEASISVPLSGTATATGSGGGALYVYVRNASGDVFRIKTAHILNGGCIERLYSASDNLDSNGKKMVARKFAVAGQYLAVYASTEDESLPKLSDEAEEAWSVYETGLIQAKKEHKLITKDFYWLINHLAEPQNSTERVKVIDLLTSKTGIFRDINAEIGSLRYHTNDMLIKGNTLYFTAYMYRLGDSFILKASDKEIVEGMGKIWDAARSGLPLTDSAYKNFGLNSETTLFTVNLDNATISKYAALPQLSETFPTSLFTRLTSDENSIYLRGENKYFAKADATDITNMVAGNIEAAKNLTPWASVYDSVQKKIINLFIIDNYETIDPALIQ